MNQDYVFIKVDFHKAYGRLEWSFILESMDMMGFGPKVIGFVQTLFGNAQARAAMNNALSKPFWLKRYVRKGCPLAPLLFAMAVDALNWLVKAEIPENRLRGISFPDRTHQCLSQFADDTNCLVNNNEINLSKLSGRAWTSFAKPLDLRLITPKQE
ncbi:hypothetical protein L7F22_048250 [Adiantum nelumboides]|nr:hypothetical protein [Adiantum nelumboides]